MSDELAIAIISLTGVLVTAMIAWQRVRLEKQKADLASLELDLQREALSLDVFLEDWNAVAAGMSRIIENTEVDRILILRAWNGSRDPKWTTSIYQMREVGQEPRQYVNFELDADYVDRIKRTVGDGRIYFVTDQENDCFIKSVYESEGVKASMWAHIETRRKRNTKDAAMITYLSFSTHSDKGITPETQTECLVLASHLKGMARDFTDKQTINVIT